MSKAELAAALRAYDTAVIDHRAEVTRLHAELDGLRAQLEARRPLVEACDAIPDITLSKWACNLGGYWEPVRAALRAARLAKGLDVDAPIMSGFDSNGWLFARADAPAAEQRTAVEEWVCVTCEQRNVTRSDEDRCCLQCGMDLTERGELLRFLLAPAVAQ